MSTEGGSDGHADPTTPWEEWSEVEQLRYRLRSARLAGDVLWRSRAKAEAELEAARPVVEAADAYATAMKAIGAYRPDADPSLDRLGELADAQRTSREALLAAVDLYRSATSDHPSTTEEKP